MITLVCTKCDGNQACTLFFPDGEREYKPSICGPDKDGLMRITDWFEAPAIQ